MILFMLYLDNSATTQILPEVKEAMLPFLFEQFGNPSSKYYDQATTAKEAVTQARQSVAQLLHCKDSEVIFTSGSTESNNMFIKGVAHQYKSKGKHLITTEVEHPSVLECFKFLEKEGFEITILKPDQYGRISVEQLKAALRSDTIFVSIMWGNNEVGSLNPIYELSSLCKSKDILFHTDATQVVGKIQVDLSNNPGISFLSCSAHKFHGPKGIGVAFIRSDEYGILTPITPLLHGGGQENDIRSGTLALHNIVGIGAAAKIAFENLENHQQQLHYCEDLLVDLLKSKFKQNIRFNNDFQNKIPGILSVEFIGINNEILLKKLAPYIAASTGSACSSSKPSHVLSAMGLSLESIRSTVRFSLSPYITPEDLEIFKSL